MGGFTLRHRDDLDRDGKWLLARRSLEVSSFGINLVELRGGESIPEHDEKDRDQEEVFCVLSGSAVVVIDGEDHPAPTGTFVRFDPEVRRTARNDGDEPVTLLMVSAPQGSGYEPMSWA
jgi:quercetin dioxygenase-like cupin family protein